MTKRRRINDDEAKLWQQVTKNVTPIQRDIDHQPPKTELPAKTEAKKQPTKAQKPIAPFEIGQNADSVKGSQPPAGVSSSQQLDRRTYNRLIKGQIQIDAHLDLHGLTAMRAQGVFTTFVQQQHRAGARVLLVVTGKGRHITQDEFRRPRSGVIRASLQDWVRQMPLSPIVLRAVRAQNRHGGDGAYYIYLRRKRGIGQ